MSFDIERNAQLGRSGIRAADGDGNYDNPAEDKHTGLTDALANIMHAAKADDVDFDSALESARDHFGAEQDGRS